jgi:hypothetical protein
MLGYGDLARPDLASIHRALTEAYVALDAQGLAETACAAWREADPDAALDPIEMSPKILRVCVNAASSHPAPPPPEPSAAPPVPPKSLLPPPRRSRGGR